MKKLSGSLSIEREKCTWNWSDLLTGRGKKAMTIGIALGALNQFSGCFAIMNYLGMIFEVSGSKIPISVAEILIVAISFVGSVVSTPLVDRLGRKVMPINQRSNLIKLIN